MKVLILRDVEHEGRIVCRCVVDVARNVAESFFSQGIARPATVAECNDEDLTGERRAIETTAHAPNAEQRGGKRR